MSVLAFASGKASPGVTTAVLALAAVWPRGRKVLVVEADPDGGVVASRYGLSPQTGLASLAAASRRGLQTEELWAHVQQLPGGTPILLGAPSADQARRVVELVAAPLAQTLVGEKDLDVLVDCGRLRPGSPAGGLIAVAASVFLVTRPRLEELAQLPGPLAQLKTAGRSAGVVLVGERPYRMGEVAGSLGTEVVGVVADDPGAASALADGSPRQLRRSQLLRSARILAQRLANYLEGNPSAAGGRSSDEWIGAHR